MLERVCLSLIPLLHFRVKVMRVSAHGFICNINTSSHLLRYRQHAHRAVVLNVSEWCKIDYWIIVHCAVKGYNRICDTVLILDSISIEGVSTDVASCACGAVLSKWKGAAGENLVLTTSRNDCYTNIVGQLELSATLKCFTRVISRKFLPFDFYFSCLSPLSPHPSAVWSGLYVAIWTPLYSECQSHQYSS